MTAICGVISLDGAEILQEDLDQMMGALAHHGPGGVQLLKADLLAPRNVSRGGSAPATHPSTPRTASHLTIVGVARIDNRDELCQGIGIAPAEQQDYDEQAL